jgi:dihydroneopterin triphosphate diphosphatase
LVYKIPASVLVIVHDPLHRILMIERAGLPGFWQSVTGAKDRIHEAWRATAVREVAEETGIVVGPAGLPDHALCDWGVEQRYVIFPIWRQRYAPGVVCNTERVFSLQVPQATPICLAPREHVRYQWLAPEPAAALCFSPSNAQAILQLAPRAASRIME